MTLSEESEDVNRLVGQITKKDEKGQEVIVYHLKGMLVFEGGEE
jgi:hypothetical protein